MHTVYCFDISYRRYTPIHTYRSKSRGLTTAELADSRARREPVGLRCIVVAGDEKHIDQRTADIQSRRLHGRSASTVGTQAPHAVWGANVPAWWGPQHEGASS